MAQYHVNLAFTADTGKAKAQLQDLQNQLTNLVNKPHSQLGVTTDIQEAIKAAVELKTHLQAATNVKTGTLDFTKLNQSLKNSGTSLAAYAQKLQQLGPTGQQAFMTLAQSVAQAEIPIRRSNQMLTDLWVTLKNTARWQVSSSVLHGFMGAVQTAYGYAQDLNESLTDIRIVTGQSSDEMARFAQQANKAAKELSTSTTNYTKASLIYYQQGLNDQQVKDRTDITVKMANVTRTSAQEVSDQMTAVWNNFYDGSKSLEYYADVMTALGAATASSTDEISEGLNKFAAIAETVGLSYEYSAAALATVTATTRESADVVGNAFKTLFARIQGLKLGETLEDGTDLNKYSQALKSVGIDIKDVNGDIKDMDQILDEMGAKWVTLAKDQQIALAQTVAGVRQYAQLMALMDNWDYFQENLGVANTSAGALEEQAEIYAESWEAAQKRVEAAAQSIYQSLINDDFFIGLLDGFEKVLTFVDKLIDNVGGLKGVLSSLGLILTKVFSDQMAKSLTNLSYNIRMSTEAGRKKIAAERDQTLADLGNNFGGSSDTQKTQFQEYIRLQRVLSDKASQMTDEEISINQQLLDRYKLLTDIVAKREEELAVAKREQSDATEDVQVEFERAQRARDAQVQASLEQALKNKKSKSAKEALIKSTDQSRQTYNAAAASQLEAFTVSLQLQTNYPEMLTAIKNGSQQTFNQLLADVNKVDANLAQHVITLQQAEVGSDAYNKASAALTRGLRVAGLEAKDFLYQFGMSEEVLNNVEQKTRNVTAANRHFAESMDDVTESGKGVEDSINNSKGGVKTWADDIVTAATAVTGFVSALNMISGAMDILSDPDTSGWEKFTTVLMTLGMIIPTLTSAWTALKTVIGSETLVKIANTLATWGQVAAEKALNKEKGIQPQKIKENITETVQDTKKKIQNTVDELKGNFGKIKESWNNSAWDKASPKMQGKFRADAVKKSGFKAIGKNQYNFNGQTVDLKTANQGLTNMSKSMAGKQAFGGVLKSLGLIAAGITIIITSVKLLDQWWNKDANAAKKAQEEADTLNNIYGDIKNEYDSLKSAITSYQDVTKSLEEMQKGTVEWYEAISQANEEAMKLINTYDNLKYTINDDGLIEIDADSLNQVRSEHLAKAMSAQRASNSANAEATRTQQQADETEFYRKHAKSSGWSNEDTAITLAGTGIGIGAGMIAGATIGSVVPVVGTLVGALVGLTAGIATAVISQSDVQDEEQRVMEALAQQYSEDETALVDLRAAIEKTGTTDTKLIESLMKNADETIKLAKQMASNTEALRAAEATSLRSFLDTTLTGEKRSMWENSKDKEHITNMMVKDDLGRTTAANALKGDLNKGWFGWSWLFGGASDEDVHKAYAKQMGWDTSEGYKNTTGGATFTVGGQERTIDDDTMRRFLAEEAGRTAQAEQLERYITAFNQVRSESMEAALNSGLSLDNQDTLADMTTDFFGGNKDAFAAATQEEIVALQKSLESGVFNISDEQAQLAGYKNAQAYLKAMEDAIANWDPQIAAAKRAKQEQEEFENILNKGAESAGTSAQAIENYAESLMASNKALANNKKAAAAAAVALTKFSKGVDNLHDALEDNLDVLKAWDEGSIELWESVAEVQAAIEDMFGVKVSANYVRENLAELMKLAEGDTAALQDLREEAAKDYIIGLGLDPEATNTITSFLDDIINQDHNLEVGASVDLGDSVDQINKLLEAGVITAEQVTAAFGAIGYEPNIEWRTKKGPPTTTETTSDIYVGGTKILSAKSVNTSVSDVSVPYITSSTTGDDVASDGSSFVGSGVGSSMTKTTTSDMLAGSLSSKTKDPLGKNTGGGNKKDFKDLDAEKERYYEINELLDDLAKKLDLIDKKKSRAFGKAKSDLIKEELGVIEQEIAATEDLINAITQDIPNDMANLAAFGATFDENNNITNYDEIYAAEVAAYNAAVATGDEATIAAAEKRWELFEGYLEQYEKTMDAYDDAVAKQMDNKIKKYEKLFEDLTYTVEVKLDIEEDQVKLLDHLLTMLEDKAFSAAEAIGLLGQKTQTTLNQAQIYSQGITDLLSLHGLDEESIQAVLNGTMSIDDLDEYGFSDEDVAKLREYMDGLMQCNEDLMELRNTVQEKVVEAFDEFNEELDRNIAKIEYLTGVIDSLRNIIDLVGQATLGLDDDFMNNLANAKVQTSTDNLTANKAKYDSNVSQLAYAQEQLRIAQERGDEESVKQWTKTVNELTTKVQDSHNAMLSSWENALQAAQEAFELAVDQAIATYEKAISGTFGNLEDLQNAFDQQSEILDRYVEDYEKIYELSKLNRDINNSIDLTGNVKAKQALRDLQVEINELQASDTKMSEYDLKYLRQKYNLRLAEIALEEAQNAKSQVRMRKDSEGNYSYVFTADENKIEEARQNYEDALYEMQDLNTQYIREMQANILQSEIELANALRALDRTKYKSDAEYYAEVDRITAYYMGQRSYYMGELDKGLQNNQTTYAYDWYNYSQYTGYKISADEDYIDSFNETVYAQLTGYTSIEDAQNKFKQATEIMVEDLKTAFTNWQNAIKTIMEAAGTSIETFGETTGATLEQIVTDSGEAAEEVTEDAEQFVDAFAIICDEVTNWQIVYSSAISEAIASNTEMIGSCGSLISMLSEVDGKLVGTGTQFATTAAAIEAAAARIQAAAAAAAAAAASVNSTSVPTTPPSVNPTNPTTPTDVKLDPYIYYKDQNAVTGRSYAYAPVSASSITTSGWEAFQGMYLVEKGYGNTRRAVLISAYLASPGAISIAKFSPLKTNTGLGTFPGLGFDTGGYTGSWGEDGRIAMLHQKELVLNAADTENMLKAVEIVRNIVKVIDLNAGAQSQGLGTLSTGTAQVGDQVLEQSVMITAEFPNATDHNEIEMAFDTLINRASQFANRKKM